MSSADIKNTVLKKTKALIQRVDNGSSEEFMNKVKELVKTVGLISDTGKI